MYPSSEELRKQFTWVTRFGDVYPAYVDSGDKIKLPRGLCPIGEIDKRVDGIAINCKLNFEPRNDEQVRVIDESISRLKNGESFIVQASTGFGKTAISAPIIHAVGRKTLIVVSKSDLIQQWRNDLAKFLSLPKEKIGFIRQDKYDVVGKDIVIGMLHSLAIPDRYPSGILKEFGFVIFDEVHVLGADTFGKVACMFPARLRMGLSATPERADGKERLFMAHIGPVKVIAKLVPMNPKVLRMETGWRCPRQVRHTASGPQVVQIPHAPGKDKHVVKIMAKNQQRNELIGWLIKSCYEKGRHLVVFSDIRAHLEQLAAVAMKNGVPQKEIGFYWSGPTRAQLDIVAGKKVVLATYGMAGVGTNYPWWDAMIMATPRGGAKQIIGRVLREYPDKKTPIIFDLIDSDSPVYKGYARTRYELYKSKELSADVKDVSRPTEFS